MSLECHATSLRPRPRAAKPIITRQTRAQRYGTAKHSASAPPPAAGAAPSAALAAWRLRGRAGAGGEMRAQRGRASALRLTPALLAAALLLCAFASATADASPRRWLLDDDAADDAGALRTRSALFGSRGGAAPHSGRHAARVRRSAAGSLYPSPALCVCAVRGADAAATRLQAETTRLVCCAASRSLSRRAAPSPRPRACAWWAARRYAAQPSYLPAPLALPRS